MLELAFVIVTALLLDAIFGEPKSYHPLVGFGVLANRLEKNLNRPLKLHRKLAGLMALLICLWPFYLLWLVLAYLDINHLPIDILILYLAIGRKSLMEHGQQVADAWQKNHLAAAREKLSRMVSRDTQNLSEKNIIKGTIESILENSNDAIYGAIFWYAIAGAPAVVLYRLSNTLDAMWGYKNKRFRDFGWAAARLDDVMNIIPARLTVFSFALLGWIKGRPFWQSLRKAFYQGRQCSSFNGGPVMAAGAIVLDIKLGGKAVYKGITISKPLLGGNADVEPQDIKRAMDLVNRVCLLWMIILGGIAVVEAWWPAIIGS